MIWSALVIGLLGSMHCMGMCGPLALAIPVKNGNRLASLLLYNGGRIGTYAILGAIFGLFGLGVQLAGYQSYLSILAGIFVLAWVLYGPFHQWMTRITSRRVDQFLRVRIVSQFKRHTYKGIFMIGIFNGLLPCGLIYIAIVAALETGYVELAALYMLMFGLGTALPLGIAMYSKPFFSRIKLLRHPLMIPIFSSLLGTMFIIRGVIYMLPPEAHESTLVEILSTITLCHIE